MRRRRTLHAALALTLCTVTLANATPAAAAGPGTGGTRCDVAVNASGTTLDVEMTYADLGTGADGGVPHLYETVDDTWSVSAPVPGPAYSVAPHESWLTVPDANWVNSRKDNGSTGGTSETDLLGGLPGPSAVVTVPGPSGPGGTPATTTFRTAFFVPQRSFLNRLDLTYAADNGVTFVLNGVPVGGYDPPVADDSAFQQERALVYTGALIREGWNELHAVVTDHGEATGLLVRGGFFGCAVVQAEPGICLELTDAGATASLPVAIPLHTGERNGVRDAYGTPDAKWRNGTTLGDVYSVRPYSGWYTGSTVANWIHVSTDTSTVGLGTYRYRTEFGFEPGSTYRDLDLRWAADNAVTFVLNGVVVGSFLGQPLSHFQTLHPFFLTAGLAPGTNVLDVYVSDNGTASGLLIEGHARACYRGVLT